MPTCGSTNPSRPSNSVSNRHQVIVALTQPKHLINFHILKSLRSIRSRPEHLDLLNRSRISYSNMLTQRITTKARAITDCPIDLSLATRSLERQTDPSPKRRSVRLDTLKLQSDPVIAMPRVVIQNALVRIPR